MLRLRPYALDDLCRSIRQMLAILTVRPRSLEHETVMQSSTKKHALKLTLLISQTTMTAAAADFTGGKTSPASLMA